MHSLNADGNLQITWRTTVPGAQYEIGTWGTDRNNRFVSGLPEDVEIVSIREETDSRGRITLTALLSGFNSGDRHHLAIRMALPVVQGEAVVLGQHGIATRAVVNVR